MFDVTSDILEPERITRYRVSHEGDPLTYADVIDRWQKDAVFQDYFTSLLVESPYAGFRWETPSLTTETAHRTFEFVLVNAAGFARRTTDRNTYARYFKDTDEDHGVVSFENLRGDAMLVVPSPRTDQDVYGHLAAFVRGAPRDQVRSLWRVLGRNVAARLSRRPLWVSTAGGGVAWLHVRIDSRPKYYSYRDYAAV